MKKYGHYAIPFILVSIVFYKQILHPFTFTFNFADNWGHLFHSVRIREIFASGNFSEIGTIVVPLYTYLFAFLWQFVSEIFLMNVVYIGHIVLAWIGAYKLFFSLSKNKNNSLLGATIFALNSLTIYANWYNLMGLCWIPFVVYYLLQEQKSFWKILIFSVVLMLSGHYYILSLWVIYLSFLLYHIFYTKKTISFLKQSLFPVILAFILAWVVYILPIFLVPDGLGDLQNANESNKVIVKSADVVSLFLPNQFNPITDSYGHFFSDFNWPLRYSYYFGILTILLFLGSIFVGWKKKKNSSLYSYFVLLAIVSFIMYCGAGLRIWSYEIIPFLPFKLSEVFWLSGIFRKSVYFFYILAFALWWMVALSNIRIKSLFIVLLLCLWITLENNFSFTRPVHIYEDFSFTKLEKQWKILALPNTSYSITKRKYILSRRGYDVFLYRDASVPREKNKYLYFKEDCLLHSLVSRKQKCTSGYAPNLSILKKENVRQIILFKRHQIVYFFRDSWNNPNGYYKSTKKILDAYPTFFIPKEENEDYVIYDVKY